MAFSANTAWEVRTTGNNANGGGFNAQATGTDYSQQDSPQVAFTDLVIGATTTQLTSVANPFTAAHVGNIINITGGTGFTVQRVQIVSVAGVIATCDKACGTAASTGGVGNLGGGLATIAQAYTLATVVGMQVWVKSGTYTQTVTLSPSTSFLTSGYSTTHGDSGKATITTATNSVNLITPNTTASGMVFQNLNFSSTAGTPGSGLFTFSTTATFFVYNCSFSGFSNGVSSVILTGLFIYNTSFIGCGVGLAIGTSSNANSIAIDTCYFEGCTTAGISYTGLGYFSITKTIIASCVTGIAMVTTARNLGFITNCTITGNTTAGITLSIDWLPPNGQQQFVTISSCIIYGNGGFGVAAPASVTGQCRSTGNAVGSNTSGNYSNIVSTGDVSLSGNPFTSSASHDYSLNNTAGAGAACKGSGFPGAFPGGTTTGHIDIGAVQSASGSPPPASTGGSYAYV